MNIRELRTTAKLTQQELADKTGIPRNRIAKWEEGKGSPKTEDTKTLVKLFSELIPNFHELADSEAIYNLPNNLTVIETQHDIKDFISRRREKKNNDSGPFMVPFVPIAAQAGYRKGYLQESFIKELERFPILPGIDPRGQEWRYFEVSGDSMESELSEKDLVLCSLVPTHDYDNIRNYYVHVIVTDEEILIKRLYKKSSTKWVLISDNEKNYPQELFDPSRTKELWVWRRSIKDKIPPPKRFEIKI
jgi:phage repressor protein C with HTH and peptisase S24 domain